MPKSDRPLEVEIPRPQDDQPAWSKVGVVAVVGFAVGILWPRFAGVRVGPSVPGEQHAAAEASARASAAQAAASAAPSAAPSATPSSAPSASPTANQELVVVGPAKTTKCYDKKDKKVEDCEKLAFDAIASQKLKSLASCPSALGLEGKMTIAFEFYFDKKEVKVEKVKKGSTFPSSTVTGIVHCAAKEFAGVAIEDIPHKHRRYTMQVPLTFYPPNKHPAEEAGGEEGEEKAEKAGDKPADAAGSAVVAWDMAILRKEPRDGETITKLPRGTKVKIQSKQGDWMKIESNGKVGWMRKDALGL